MTVDYEVVKRKARLAIGGKMNIVERSAFWFRYERNSQSPREDYSEEHIETHTPEPAFVKRQWDIVNQLRGEMRFLSSKVNELRARKNKQRMYKYK